MSERCGDCIYWLDRKPSPFCRRDPHFEIHGEGDWCGEYKNKEGRFPVTSEPGADRGQPNNNPAISASENAAKAVAPPPDIQDELEKARKENASLKSLSMAKRRVRGIAK